MDQNDDVQPRHRDTIGNLFLRLGYDISENTDVQRLAANLRYAEQHRKDEENKDTNKMAWIVTAIIAVIGSAATVVGQLIFNKIFGVMPK